MSEQLKACPFCDSGDISYNCGSPLCLNCYVTVCSTEKWNTRTPSPCMECYDLARQLESAQKVIDKAQALIDLFDLYTLSLNAHTTGVINDLSVALTAYQKERQ